MTKGKRDCPYCNQQIVNRLYWRHIEAEHPENYRSDKNTWLQLFEDYTSMGMDKERSLTVLSQLFNREPSMIKSFLQKSGKF